MTEAEKEEYFRKLDAKPQSAAPSDPSDPLKAIMIASTLRDPATTRAKKLLEEGMHPHGVWRETGRELVPGTTNRWMKEISDSKARVREGPHMTPDKKLVPGWYRLPTVLEHDELYDAVPKFKDTRVVIGELNEGVHGSFNPEINQMSLSASNLSDPMKGNTLNTIIHELQHPLQTSYGWPEGTNQGFMTLSDKEKEGLKLLRSRGPQPEKRQELLKVIDALGGDPWQLYHKTLGEQQARVAEMRRFLTPAEQLEYPPSALYEFPEHGFNLKDFKGLKREAARTYEPKNEPDWVKLQDIISGMGGK
jgi:hypothetical protein